MDVILPLVVVPLLISRVGISNYGKYAFSYSLIFYFLNFVQYGFSLTGVRDVSINRENKFKLNIIYNKILFTKIVLCLVSLIFLTFIVFSINDLRTDYKLYIFMSLILIGDTFSMSWFFQGIEKMKLITLVNFFSKLTYLLFVYFLVKEASDYIYIGLYQSFGYILSSIIGVWIIQKEFKFTYRLINLKTVFNQLKEGFNAFLTMVAPLLYSNTSIFFTGVFGLPINVSFIEIASKISGGFTSLNNIVAQVFFPYLNKKKNKSNLVQNILMGTGLIFSIMMFFLAPLVVDIWLPENSKEINKVVKILSLSPFFISVSSAFGLTGLMIHKKDKIYSKIILGCSILGLISAIILIPFYYHIAAAITFVFSRGLIALFTFKSYKKIIKS